MALARPECPLFDPTNVSGDHELSWENDMFLTGHCVPSKVRLGLYIAVIAAGGSLVLLGTIATIVKARRFPAFAKSLAFATLCSFIGVQASA
ncbi:hypothetical protein HK102_013139 [Quaeritorhiza haematococci]|nr:hypothetical protein HK102_013139 [Quaeritorhiza haematococci]